MFAQKCNLLISWINWLYNYLYYYDCCYYFVVIQKQLKIFIYKTGRKSVLKNVICDKILVSLLYLIY